MQPRKETKPSSWYTNGSTNTIVASRKIWTVLTPFSKKCNQSICIDKGCEINWKITISLTWRKVIIPGESASKVVECWLRRLYRTWCEKWRDWAISFPVFPVHPRLKYTNIPSHSFFLNKPFQGAGISANNVRGWDVVLNV